MSSQQQPYHTFTSASAPITTASTTTIRGQWSTSDKYVRFELLEKEKFDRVMRRHGLNESRSPFLPSNWQEYLSHRADTLDDKIAAEKTAIAAKEEAARVRRSKPASAEVVPVFGGRDLRGVAAPCLEDYRGARGRWWAVREDVVVVVSANKEMDEDVSFRRRGEFLVGEDLAKKL
ncbi:hypothetical protein PMZ80_003425 [Knufia obscura]|uniref:Uncharacterized protein n=2 Tax=Knufia TaxID=430999 RepID=A0AAN8ICM5_9EURO|nr:hypothetical protein PMZ80_003425 [Knufia obscura]KAK5958656.1 hypothetical protein OHC33_000499 [Knufia fluminis]